MPNVQKTHTSEPVFSGTQGEVCSYLVFPRGLLKDQEVRILLLYYWQSWFLGDFEFPNMTIGQLQSDSWWNLIYHWQFGFWLTIGNSENGDDKLESILVKVSSWWAMCRHMGWVLQSMKSPSECLLDTHWHCSIGKTQNWFVRLYTLTNIDSPCFIPDDQLTCKEFIVNILQFIYWISIVLGPYTHDNSTARFANKNN